MSLKGQKYHSYVRRFLLTGLWVLKDIQNSRQSGRSKNTLVGKKSRDTRKLVAAANALLILIV